MPFMRTTSGVFHTYYLHVMGPPLGALAGIGWAALRRPREGGWRHGLSVTLLVTAAWLFYIERGTLDGGPTWHTALFALSMVGLLAAAVGTMVLSPRLRGGPVARTHSPGTPPASAGMMRTEGSSSGNAVSMYRRSQARCWRRGTLFNAAEIPPSELTSAPCSALGGRSTPCRWPTGPSKARRSGPRRKKIWNNPSTAKTATTPIRNSVNVFSGTKSARPDGRASAS